MNFYSFNQNNSGGSFTTNEKLCYRVIIEANSEQEAILKAEELGIYFNGVEEGYDCPCCGDRWYYPDMIDIEKYKSEGYPAYEYSKIYKNNIEEYWNNKYGMFHRKEEPKKHKHKRFGDYGTQLFFKDIEDYCQFMSNSFISWTTPDCRIFYDNGDIKEINNSNL